jgi:hypothetical protein
MSSTPTGEVFHLVLIEPSHYDDEVMTGLGLHCAQRRSLAEMRRSASACTRTWR